LSKVCAVDQLLLTDFIGYVLTEVKYHLNKPMWPMPLGGSAVTV
jgi:hypothetical protein